MIAIIAGGRKLPYTDENRALLQRLIVQSGFDISEVVSGACGIDDDDPDRDDRKCKGGDYLGEAYANDHGIPVTRFYAAWRREGRRIAGPRRNRRMADYARALIWLPGEAGTRSMIRLAISRGLSVFPIITHSRDIEAIANAYTIGATI